MRAGRTPGRWYVVAVAVATAAGAMALHGQVAQNARDPFGIAIPYRLVHLAHSVDVREEGTTAHLRAKDPFLLYQLGRDLVNRQFELKHGILGRPGDLSVPLYVGATRSNVVHGGSATRFARDHAASCGMCHSSVYREPSAGQTIGSTGGLGRNTSHFFGAGLVEMIGDRITRELLFAYDTNRNGVIDRAELKASVPASILPAPGAEPIDFGDLGPGPGRVPQLNSAFRLWYVDVAGRVVPEALSLEHPGVTGFGFAMQPFGWGRGQRQVGQARVSQGGEASTVREFYTVAADFHMGLEAYDPTQRSSDPRAIGAGGYAKVSLSGAQQYDFGGAIDLGRRLCNGVSIDDPDADGYVSELTEGDVDAAEFFLLHAPAPAVRVQGSSEAGRPLLRQIGCTRCHTESWTIPAADRRRGFTGDRRLFSLETHMRTIEGDEPELVGTIVQRSRLAKSGAREPARGGFVVERIYTDFKHWDIGPAFHERRFDGSVQTVHRTAPLWGVGNTGPYGHSGNFMDARSVIVAHAGAASRERDAFLALTAADREAVLAYLKSLVLFQTDEIPSDIDGDGVIREDFMIAGQPVGYERFLAHYLFREPPQYEILGAYVHPNGRSAIASLITNIDEAFGLTLRHRRDPDGDGFPVGVGCPGPATGTGVAR